MLYIPGNKFTKLIEVTDFIRQGFCWGSGKFHGKSVERETGEADVLKATACLALLEDPGGRVPWSSTTRELGLCSQTELQVFPSPCCPAASLEAAEPLHLTDRFRWFSTFLML